MTAWGSVLANPASPGSVTVNWTRGMVGLFNPGGDATLNSVGVFMHDTNVGTYRIAVYQGGTSDTNPSGATLIWQSGELTAPGASGWDDEVATGTLTGNTRTWIFIKDNNNNVVLQATTSSGERSDATTGGRVAVYEHTNGDDETAAFPATMNNGSQDSYSQWYRMRLDYTLGGGGSTYQLSPTTSAAATAAVSMAARRVLGPVSVAAAVQTTVSGSSIAQLAPTVGAAVTTSATLYKVTSVDAGQVDCVSTVSALIQVQKPMAASVAAAAAVSASLSGNVINQNVAQADCACTVAVSMAVVRAVGTSQADATSAASVSVASVRGLGASQADAITTVSAAMQAVSGVMAESAAQSSVSVNMAVVYALGASVDMTMAASVALTATTAGAEPIVGRYSAQHSRAYQMVKRAGGR